MSLHFCSKLCREKIQGPSMGNESKTIVLDEDDDKKVSS